MQWLEAELEESRTQSQRVIVLCHVLVHPETSKEGKTLLWNYDQVRKCTVRLQACAYVFSEVSLRLPFNAAAGGHQNCREGSSGSCPEWAPARGRVPSR
eukprot:scaffold567_cov384-Prasinococcus_capsulatus_cf.AAC.2